MLSIPGLRLKPRVVQETLAPKPPADQDKKHRALPDRAVVYAAVLGRASVSPAQPAGLLAAVAERAGFRSSELNMSFKGGDGMTLRRLAADSTAWLLARGYLSAAPDGSVRTTPKGDAYLVGRDPGRPLPGMLPEWRLRAILGRAPPSPPAGTIAVPPSPAEAFRWPTTAAPGGGPLTVEAPSDGVLVAVGYRVGRSRGEPPSRRKAILERLFLRVLPDVPGVDKAEWGSEDTGQRLRKLANTVAALARNAKRRGPTLAVAVSEWEADLVWLKTRFYVGRFDFPWPGTA